MSKIVMDQIRLYYSDAQGLREEFRSGPNSMEEIFEWLIEAGIYDDIQATKRFSTSKTVMNTMRNDQ